MSVWNIHSFVPSLEMTQRTATTRRNQVVILTSGSLLLLSSNRLILSIHLGVGMEAQNTVTCNRINTMSLGGVRAFLYPRAHEHMHPDFCSPPRDLGIIQSQIDLDPCTFHGIRVPALSESRLHQTLGDGPHRVRLVWLRPEPLSRYLANAVRIPSFLSVTLFLSGPREMTLQLILSDNIDFRPLVPRQAVHVCAKGFY